MDDTPKTVQTWAKIGFMMVFSGSILLITRIEDLIFSANENPTDGLRVSISLASDVLLIVVGIALVALEAKSRRMSWRLLMRNLPFFPKKGSLSARAFSGLILFGMAVSLMINIISTSVVKSTNPGYLIPALSLILLVASLVLALPVNGSQRAHEATPPEVSNHQN